MVIVSEYNNVGRENRIEKLHIAMMEYSNERRLFLSFNGWTMA